MWLLVKIAVLIADNALRQSFITVFDELSECRSGNDIRLLAYRDVSLFSLTFFI